MSGYCRPGGAFATANSQYKYKKGAAGPFVFYKISQLVQLCVTAGNNTYNTNIGVGSSVNCALSLPTGLKDNSLSSLIDLSVFPNPGTEHYYINLPVDAQVSLFDASGNLLLSQTGKGGTNLLNLTGYLPGIYIVKVADGRYYGTVNVIKE